MLPVGALPVPPTPAVTHPAETPLALRVNQRLAAQVLGVKDDQVTLAINGARVVARLINPEQAGALSERRVAQFVVRGLVDQTLALQLVTGPDGKAITRLASGPELAAALLAEAGLPETAENLMLARALVARNLPLNAGTLREMATLLEGVPGWTQADADAAVALKAAGLPLSPGALELVKASLPEVADALRQLAGRLQALLKENLPSPLADSVRRALDLLKTLSLHADPSAQAVREAVTTLGRPLENVLARLLADPNTEKGLLALAQLQRDLALNAAPLAKDAAAELARALDALRLMQLGNLPPERAAATHWLQLQLPLEGAPAAHLRIASRPGQDGPARVDAAHTRLVLQVPLDGADMLEVDLSVLGKQVSAWVTATSDDLRAAAEAELPDLQRGLSALGFGCQAAHVLLGQPAPPLRLDEPAGDAHPHTFTGLNIQA